MEAQYLPSWKDFMNVAESHEGWVFRGQENADWPLVSSLTRYLGKYCPDTSLWPLREERAVRIFRRKAHIYLRDPSVLDDDLRCLALMQHHGAPTRLLDFTKSPFVAAFFALQHATGDTAVFALNTPRLWHSAPVFDAALDRDAIDPRKPGTFRRLFLGNDKPVVWFGEPNQLDKRLVAQSGVLMIPGMIDRPLDQLLESYGPPRELVRKFILPVSVRDEAMRALYRMNLTHATLFPDLEGLSRSIAYELEMVWDQLIEDFRHAHPS